MSHTQIIYGPTRLLAMATLAITALAITALGHCAAAFSSEELVRPEKLIVDKSLDQQQVKTMSLAAQRYYTFWHTGDPKLAELALHTKFIDLNLPAGRPQGAQGPVQASAQFRAAVPDLQLRVEEMIIVGDRVIGRLHFYGHFTGRFQGKQGQGQKIEFSAVDLYRIEDGKVKENWHLEDNQTLMNQLAVGP